MAYKVKRTIWDVFPWSDSPPAKPKKLKRPSKAEQAAIDRVKRAAKWLAG